MGDEVNDFDMPIGTQSGNDDTGHHSILVEPDEDNIRDIAQQDLDNVIEPFVSQNTNFNEFRSSLFNLGYTTEQTNDLIRAGQEERAYRELHGEPSGLAFNQLEFLATQQAGGFVTLDNLTIRQDENGRKYLDDPRVREDDGTPARLYLPPEAEFDPITRRERGRLRQIEAIEQTITLQDPDPSGHDQLIYDEISQDNINRVSQLTTQYLNDPRITDEDTSRYRQRVQALPNLQNVEGIRLKLLNLFRDVEIERQFRIDSGGRPSGLTDEEWEHLQNTPALNYYGQPILTTETDPPQKYIFTGTGYSVINPNEMTPIEDNTLTNSDNRELNLYAMDYLSGDVGDSRSDLVGNMLDAIDYHPTNPNEFSKRLQVENLAIQYEAERTFRENNDGRPSQLTPLQYEFLVNHTLTETQDGRSEPRYRGEPIEINSQGVRGFYSYDSNDFPEMLMIPTDDIINTMIQNGTYVRPAPDRIPVQDILDALGEAGSGETIELPQAPVLPRLPNNPIKPIGIPDIPQPEPINPSLLPPVVPGTTRAIDPITQEEQLVPTPQEQVDRYEQYFNDNQSSYFTFRDTFRDLLPVFTGATAGFFAYSLARIRERGTIDEIIQQERLFLEQLELRLENFDELVENYQKGYRSSFLDILTKQEELRQQEPRDPSMFEGGQEEKDLILKTLQSNIEASTEEIKEAQEQLELLQNDMANKDITRTEVNNRIDDLMSRDRQILMNIYRYSPEILQGFSIGSTIGLVLSGYFFPTYVNINEPYVFADNIEYNKDGEKNRKRKDATENISKRPREVFKQVEPLPPIIDKIRKPVPQSFIPIKENKGKPLSYREIQELKSTLNESELNNLKGKFLVFGDDNKVSQIPTEDKCRNVVGETQIFKRPIKLR